MNCANPLEDALLASYWLAELQGPEEEAVEEHLMACDACGDRLRALIAIAEGVRNLAREGNLRMIVSDSFVRRAEEEGMRVRQYALPAGGGVQCTVSAEDDLLIARLAVGLGGAKRVDLCFYTEQGVEFSRLTDIPVHPEAGGVIYQEPMAMAKAAPTQTMVARLMAVDEAGTERLMGEYTFHHQRTIPGPAGW